MSETKTGRIRWHHVDGTVVEWFGYVGTMTTTPLFQILHPVAKPTDAVMGSRFDEWALCTTFPGASAETRYGGRDDGAPDRLKGKAGHWLEEIVGSLGAIFPEQYAERSENEGGTAVQIQPQCAPVPLHPEEEAEHA